MEQILTDDQIKQIALEYVSKGAAKMSKEFGVSKQRIQQVACNLRKKGVLIPRIRDLSRYGNIIDELKQEHPELFK